MNKSRTVKKLYIFYVKTISFYEKMDPNKEFDLNFENMEISLVLRKNSEKCPLHQLSAKTMFELHACK